MARRKGRGEGGGDASNSAAPARNPPGTPHLCSVCGEMVLHDESIHDEPEVDELEDVPEEEYVHDEVDEDEGVFEGEDPYINEDDDQGEPGDSDDLAPDDFEPDGFEPLDEPDEGFVDDEDEEAAIAACDADYPDEDYYGGGAWIGSKPKWDKSKTSKPPWIVDDRPIVKVSAELYENEVAATHALARMSRALGIYQRSHRLVQIAHITPTQAAASPVISEGKWGDESTKRRAKVEGTPIIVFMEKPTLFSDLTRVARFERFDGRKEEWSACYPPEHVVSAIFSRPNRAGVDEIVGLAEAPFLRPDGTVCQEPGFDVATGYLYSPSAEYPPVPDKPTQAQAKNAFKRVADLFCDFPFQDESHRNVPIAGALTVLARPGIQGSVPCCAIDGNMRGAGKSLITDVVSTLVTGRGMPRTTYPPDEVELRKVLDGYARDGASLISIDNILDRPFGGGCLDAFLTAKDTVQIRILGHTGQVAAPWRAVMFATGNNIQLYGDTSDRILMARLECPDEAPRRRAASSFKYPQLLEYVRLHRGRLVADLLIILRAFIVAKCPQMGTENWGSFEEWAARIPPAIVYAGGADPMGARITDETSVNQEIGHIAAVVAQWNTLPPLLHAGEVARWRRARAAVEVENRKQGAIQRPLPPAPPARTGMLTCKEVIDALYEPDGAAASPAFDALREAIDALCCPGRRSGEIKPTSIALSGKLRAYKGRSFEGVRIVSKRNPHTDVTWWWVESVDRKPPPGPGPTSVPSDGGKKAATPPSGKLQLVKKR